MIKLSREQIDKVRTSTLDYWRGQDTVSLFDVVLQLADTALALLDEIDDARKCRETTPPPRATVTWADSSSEAGWQREYDASLVMCETTGYVLHEDAESVVIALTRSLSHGARPFCDTITIPRSCVKSIIYIDALPGAKE